MCEADESAQTQTAQERCAEAAHLPENHSDATIAAMTDGENSGRELVAQAAEAEGDAALTQHEA